jgi:hypothetical protein
MKNKNIAIIILFILLEISVILNVIQFVERKNIETNIKYKLLETYINN